MMSYKIIYDKRVAKDIKKLRLTNAQKEKLKHKLLKSVKILFQRMKVDMVKL